MASPIGHLDNTGTNLTSNITAGATTSPLNSVPGATAPFYLAFDATSLNSKFEIVYVTSKTATNVNHAATTYAHTTAEEVRMVNPAQEFDLIYQPPQGYLMNGKISVTDAAGITVALKTLAGTDPSVTDPVYVRIGDTVRTITSALSVAKADGTNWCNAGGSELATKEIDYFVYLGYNATDGVVIGFSRFPGARKYGDFSATSTNEKYCAISTITTAASTDYYEVVGRYAATLSAGAGYTWSVPTYTAANLIQTPIYKTRTLSYTPALSYTAGAAPTTPGNENSVYWIDRDTCYVRMSKIYSGNGTTVTRCDVTLPFAGASTVDQSPIGGAIFSNSFAPIATMNQFHTTAAQLFCASSTVNRIGFFVTYEI